ncbi:MAG: late promoter transcription accessory protein [Minisyncoccia bacterium]
MEPASASKLLNANIKQKIEYEATQLNMINRGKKPAKLF